MEIPKIAKHNTHVELKEVLIAIGSQVLDSKYTLALKQLMQLVFVLIQYFIKPTIVRSTKRVEFNILEEIVTTIAIDN